MKKHTIGKGSLAGARSIFLIAALLGSVFIIIGAYFNNLFINLALPVLTMLVYIALGNRLSLLNRVGPSYADSIYYLGFIFTLIALTSTLFAFDESNMKVGQLVSNFALALVTTIIGLTMRIFFNTFYYDVNVSRRSVMDALQKETEEFIAATHTVSLRLKGIESQAVDSIEKARNDSIAQMEEVNKSINEVLITSKSAIDDASKASLIGMEKVVDQSLQKINGFNIPEDFFTSKLDIPLNTLAARIQRTSDLLDGLHKEQIRIKNSSKSVATSFVRINKNLDSSNDSLLEFSKSININKESAKSVENFSILLSSLAKEVQNAMREVTNGIEPLKGFSKEACNLRESVSGLPDSVDTLAKSLDESISTLKLNSDSLQDLSKLALNFHSYSEGMNQLLPNIKQSMGNLPQLSNSLGDLDEKINMLSSTVSSSSKVYDSMHETLKSRVDTVNDFQNQIREALTKVTEDTDKITSYLLTSTKYIAERLE